MSQGNVVHDGVQRARAVHLAEVWIRNAGFYEVDRASLVEALFGEHGLLRRWAANDALQARMIELWEDEHPRAIQANAEAEQRIQRFRLAREQRLNDELGVIDLKTRKHRGPR